LTFDTIMTWHNLFF